MPTEDCDNSYLGYIQKRT